MVNTTYATRWETARLASLFSENVAQNSDGQYSNAYQFFYGNIVPKKSYELTEDLLETYRKYTVVQPDDIMLNGLNLNYDFVTQRVASVKETGIITSAYICIRPGKETNASYYTYLLKSLDARKVFHGLGTGIRLTLSWNSIKNLRLPVPSRAEQDQIVRFLDWKTSRINRLINAKREQIANLRILKGNKINYIMSHGMGIGGVPRHCRPKGSHNWTIAPLKYFVTSNNESLTDNTKADREIDYIDISSVGFGFLKKMPEHLIFSKAPLRARRLVKTGDTIISTVRTYLRSMMYIGEELNGYVVSTGFSVLRPKQNIYPRILNYALSSNYFIDEVCRNSLGVSYPAINDGKLMRIKIALPDSAEEQEILVKRLDQDFYKLDEKINVCESEIGFLRELKTSLISDVVTGQIDVRDVEIPEYERVEETADSNSEDDEAELEEAESEVE